MLTKVIDIERLIHSTKTAIACLIGVFLIHIIGIPADQWVIITIIVVMCAQIYVGSVMQKAYLRFLGTLIGCLFAAFTLAAAGHTNTAILLSIALSSFIFSYFATSQENLSYAGTLGAVTTAIVMLGPQPTIYLAAQRFMEISMGIFIATFVSQYILPINASTHLRRAQAKTLGQLRDYYITAVMPPLDTKQQLNYMELDESIVKSLLKQRQLAKESASEPPETGFDPEHFMQSLYCEREMLRSITFMHNALTHITKARELLDQLPDSHAFNETIILALNTIIKAIESLEPHNEHIHIPSLDALRNALQKNLMEASSRHDLIYIDGFLFSAETLLISLAKLADLNNVSIYEKEKDH